jgi:hypothetical protein
VAAGKGAGFEIASTDNSDQSLVEHHWKMFNAPLIEQGTCMRNGVRWFNYARHKPHAPLNERRVPSVHFLLLLTFSEVRSVVGNDANAP